MKRALLALGFIPVLLVPSLAPAVETAPRITDREIIERLTRLEEGQNTLRAEVRAVEQSLRAEMQANAEAIRQLREDMSTQIQQLQEEMKEQNRQLREDMSAQFDRMVRIMLGILAAFAALVATTIGFAIWDRRTMTRPFESKSLAPLSPLSV